MALVALFGYDSRYEVRGRHHSVVMCAGKVELGNREAPKRRGVGLQEVATGHGDTLQNRPGQRSYWEGDPGPESKGF